MADVANTGPRPVYDIPFLDGFTVDGEAPDWGEEGFHVRLVGGHEQEQGLADQDDISVSLRLGWTREGLALFLVVRDDEYVQDPFDHRLGQGDHVAVSVADSVGGRNMVTLVVTPGMAPTH